jgi:hypothetical protein
MPIPADTGDVRVTLASDQIAEIEASIRAQTSACIETAVKDAWGRLATAVANVAEKLADTDGIFRDSLIGNVQGICDALGTLNITNDPGLETMRQTVKASLSHVAPEVLRTNKHVRAAVAADAQRILDEMASVYGVRA